MLVNFVTNTLALLVYFAIPLVANHMRSLGAQIADGHSLCSSILLLILINSLRSLSFEKVSLTSLVEFGTNTLASLVYFAIPALYNNMRYLVPQTADSNGRGN